jgi:hypothetical protein
VAAVSQPISLRELLARSTKLYEAWLDVLQAVDHAEDTDRPLRDQLVNDAAWLALEHGAAVRELLSVGIESSALALLRTQHEALLRSAWLRFCASDAELGVLGAPLTPTTLRRANQLPMAKDLLETLARSSAPEPLKRGLCEFREQSWAGVNSYAHAGLLSLGRLRDGHPEAQLVQALQSSNAHGYAACMLIAENLGSFAVQSDINVVAVSYPDCMHRV